MKLKNIIARLPHVSRCTLVKYNDYNINSEVKQIKYPSQRTLTTYLRDSYAIYVEKQGKPYLIALKTMYPRIYDITIIEDKEYFYRFKYSELNSCFNDECKFYVIPQCNEIKLLRNNRYELKQISDQYMINTNQYNNSRLRMLEKRKSILIKIITQKAEQLTKDLNTYITNNINDITHNMLADVKYGFPSNINTATMFDDDNIKKQLIKIRTLANVSRSIHSDINIKNNPRNAEDILLSSAKYIKDNY